MRRNPFWLYFCTAMWLMLVVTQLTFAQTPPSQNRVPMWTKVDEAIQKGLPKTAIEELKPIIASAIADKAYPEAIKAIAKRIMLTSQVEGNRPDVKIELIKQEIESAPKEMLPLLHALLANWYWEYFQQNAWQFANRTSVDASTESDFKTWDLKRLMAEVDKHFSKALESEDELKKIPIADYDAFLPRGSLPDSYRPTLFDFFAFVAVDFYAAGEQAGAKPEDQFEIDAASAALGSAEDFLAWKPTTTDAESPKLKAVLLYQKLLTIHLKDQDRSAFLDADLGRLRFAHANAIGEEKTVRYKAALKSFAESNTKHELSATARFRLAELVKTENDLVEARTIALQGKNAFPDSIGGKHCSNLIIEIESKSCNVITERTWTDPFPVIRVRYRNINKVYFRAVKADWLKRFTNDRWTPSQINETDRSQWPTLTPVAAWSADLPAIDDYREATHDVPAPTTLKPGYYIILSSIKPDFSELENMVAASEVWVSNLALVVRHEWGVSKLEGFVLNGKSGEPIANAKVRMFTRDDNSRQIKEVGNVATNANGLFSIKAVKDRSLFLLASHAGHEIGSASEISMYEQPVNPQAPYMHVLFTDRAIYRPGQTVHYKGITFLADTKKNEYKVGSGHNVRVVFRDPNGKDIGEQSLVTNDYGSFSGAFTTPRDRGTGMMSISVQDQSVAVVTFNVEEYKRPKFEVTLDLPKEAAKLNSEVSVGGKATAYTGVSIGGAKVRYRVTRQVQWPRWFMSCYFWRMPPNPGQSQEIAHGWTTTEADGSFKVSFVAKPDGSVPESDQPTFHYSIIADVTDSNGETRTGNKSINVGYTALSLNLDANDWQVTEKDVQIKLTATTLDNDRQTAKGTLRIHRVKQPASVLRSDLLGQTIAPRSRKGTRGTGGIVTLPPTDPANPATWALEELIETKEFETNAEGVYEFTKRLPVGHYRAIVESQDRFGKPATAEVNLRVLDPKASKLGLKIPNILAAPKWKLEPGEKLQAVWGSGYDAARAYVEVESNGRVLQSFWTKPGVTQINIEQPIEESMRGGMIVRTTCVRDNRAYFETKIVEIPWTNKELTLKWERFVSKLEPAAKETYTLTITGPDATKATAEMVAALYDASLDAYAQQHWLERFMVFRQEPSRLSSFFNNSASHFNHFRGQWNNNYIAIDERYRSFPPELQSRRMSYFMRGGGPGGFGGGGMTTLAKGLALGEGEALDSRFAVADFAAAGAAPAAPGAPALAPTPNLATPDLSTVSARTNLNETAFFFPHLVSNSDGEVKLEFTMPEALTKWRFMGFAHDRELRSGYLEDSVVTAKDLMVQPNPPRFLREGDTLEFSVKVSNRSDKPQAGKVALKLFDARTNVSIDATFANADNEKTFELDGLESKSFAWKLKVPDGAYPIIYKAVAATEKLSDGEEGMLPVLSKRILVTESLPLPVRGKSTREFDFKKLRESANSDTLQHQSLSIQMTSQPAWYAVLALPYLMEFQHECSEQTFNRLYANTLAQHIAQSDPKIHRVFETWRQFQPEALNSPLSKNQDIKSVMIEETPWLRAADKESESRRNVGILFEDSRLQSEVERAMRRLTEMQRENGMWPWFSGGPDNEYLSLYIVTGFGRLRHLNVPVDTAPAIKALDRLDAWMHEQYDRILRDSKDPEANHLNTTIALYLYGRSFFIADRQIADTHQVALNYWQRQARNYWLKLGNRQSQAHVAIGLKRLGDIETPKAIVASLKENSVSNEEMGMFWRDTEQSWWWYHAPIETQAVMIEAFDEVADDAASVEDCKVWLLKQKQTQNWKTTKATADAVYALLLRGNNLLSSNALVQVKLADQSIAPENVEAGTGFYEQKFGRGEIKSAMGKITLTKTDEGVSWGSIHWQYLEDISKVTPHDGTPLKLEKKLFKRTLTKSGPVLEAVNGPIAIGDEIVCRVTLRTDRDMEYVHMKDHRGSGTEPVNVLSQYKFQDGLFYYESTRDTASHFFIDYLAKGTYVFEYTLRVQHAGSYPSGVASIECMYAPEFNSHSESVEMDARK